MATLDLGGLLATGRDLGASLRNVVTASQEGRVDAAGTARALELGRDVDAGALGAPGAAARAIAGAEADLGVTLPIALRRVPTEVADGGFGPGPGLLPLTDVSRSIATSGGRTASCRAATRGPPGCCRWSSGTPGSTAARSRPAGSSRGTRRS